MKFFQVKLFLNNQKLYRHNEFLNSQYDLGLTQTAIALLTLSQHLLCLMGSLPYSELAKNKHNFTAFY